ncbi:50S ribosomal subunit protein L3 N(5)-glutamine methyltransferase [Gammaproteobacteria bacterium]
MKKQAVKDSAEEPIVREKAVRVKAVRNATTTEPRPSDLVDLTDLDVAEREAVLELRTVRDLIRWGTSRFVAAGLAFGHGIDNPWDEATTLTLHTLHLPPLVPDRIGNARVTISERRKVVELFRRRIAERRPAAYLTQEAWFAGLPFYVDERVLIPRSPIAELIEKGFDPWVTEQQIGRILDIGTGSGCIAVACALAFPGVEVDAVDISPDALEVARINVKRHDVGDQVKLFESDLYRGLGERCYDLIVSNPPYVSIAQMETLPAEYRHEPALGLAAGEQGLDAVLRLLQDADGHLTPEGVLVVEVGDSAAALEERLPEVPFLWLDFERGGGGVFLLTAEQIHNCRHYFKG